MSKKAGVYRSNKKFHWKVFALDNKGECLSGIHFSKDVSKKKIDKVYSILKEHEAEIVQDGVVTFDPKIKHEDIMP